MIRYRFQARIVVNASSAAARGACGRRLGRAGAAAGDAGLHATPYAQADGRRVRLRADLPDGRRLVYASQLPARPGAPRIWTETLVDLTTKTVLFNESGIDAYWSLDGTKIIYWATRA